MLSHVVSHIMLKYQLGVCQRQHDKKKLENQTLSERDMVTIIYMVSFHPLSLPYDCEAKQEHQVLLKNVEHKYTV